METTVTLSEQVDALLGTRKDTALRNLLEQNDVSLVADTIDELSHGKRKVFSLLPPERQAEVIRLLSEWSKESILPRLADDTVARILHFSDEDDAVDVLQRVPEERQMKILSLLKEEKRRKVEKLLLYAPETAGGLMDLNFVLVPGDRSLSDVKDVLKNHYKVTKRTPLVVIASMEGKRKHSGFLPYKALFLSAPTASIGSLAQYLPLLPQNLDQEEVIKVAAEHKSDVLGVTNDAGEVIGIIRLADLLGIAQREATEDVYKFAGVSNEEDMLDPPSVAIRMRYRWLVVNLATAFLASWVVSLFQGTIAQVAILAAYMPMVAGMGGNAGTQALAVMVRGLAVGQYSSRQIRHVIMKEAVTGFVNGLLNGFVVFLIVTIVSGRPMIGAILGIAMITNMVIAGVAGSLIPVILKSFRIDPAVASTVFVTTCTDICGFFTFLGLATLALRFVVI